MKHKIVVCSCLQVRFLCVLAFLHVIRFNRRCVLYDPIMTDDALAVVYEIDVRFIPTKMLDFIVGLLLNASGRRHVKRLLEVGIMKEVDKNYVPKEADSEELDGEYEIMVKFPMTSSSQG